MKGTSRRQPGFVILPASVAAAWPKLTTKAARVAVALATFMDAKGECFPARDKLMERSGVSCPFSVTRAIRELEDAGLLVARRRPNKSSRFAWTDGAESRMNRLPGKSAESTFRTSGKSSKPTANKNTEQDTASTAARKPPVWGWWIDAHRDAGRIEPLEVGPDLGAARELGKLVSVGNVSEDELRRCMALYLGDDDGFLRKTGHALRHLSGRINAYRAVMAANEPPTLDRAFVDDLERDAAEGSAT